MKTPLISREPRLEAFIGNLTNAYCQRYGVAADNVTINQTVAYNWMLAKRSVESIMNNEMADHVHQF